MEGNDVRECTMEDDVGRKRALVRCTTMVRCRTMQDETNVEQRCVALQFTGGAAARRDELRLVVVVQPVCAQEDG